MGKKQKMKKAAAAAAAAKAALKQHAAAAAAAAAKGTNNNKHVDSCEENNEVGDKKTDPRGANMTKLMNLAKTKSMPGTSRKSPGSPTYMSSDSENTDSDDSVTIVQQSVKSNKQKAAATAVDVPEVLAIPKCSRGEKKARRLLSKLNMERMPNVSRVTMRKAKNVLLCIDHPEVFKCNNTQTIICFGAVRVEDTSNAAAAQAAERYLKDTNVRAAAQSKYGDQLNDLKADNDDDVSDEDLDDSQLDVKDIELVQMQAHCSRTKAIKALLQHNGDVVNAIMDLTVG